MSAQDQMRAMLDELMGTARDGDPGESRVKFDDPRVCKSFLLGCCPHEILSSTRMDLGDCRKIHDLALKADYEQAAAKKDYFYDIDAMEHLESFIADCDRKTELAKRRLKETQEELSDEATSKAEIIHNLGEQIGTKLAKAEEMGADGNVEESLKAMEEIEELKKLKSQAEAEYRNSVPASSHQQQKLRVCEVCSAYLGIHDNDRQLADHFGGKLHLGFISIRDKLDWLKMDYRNSMPASSYQQQKLRVCEVCMAYLGIHDNDRRLADHFGGKLHIGFIEIREKLENLQKSVQERRVQREQEREARRTRDLEREREREEQRRKERRRSRSGSRSRRRSRSRSKRKSRSRSRSRSRRHRRSRSRSRSRDRRRRRRSRSRDRRRSRSRSRSRRSSRRSRSRSRSRRSRSRSRSRRKRKSRSRSRSRHRSHSRSKEEQKSPSVDKGSGIENGQNETVTSTTDAPQISPE